MSEPAKLAWGRADLLAAVAIAALVVVHTWPIASSPAATSFNYNHDAMLHTWTVAWVARTLVTAPMSLLDGNIFHPADNSLVYSDSMLAPAAMATPFYWATGDPVLTHNLAWLLGVLLSALAMALLMRALVADRWAAVLAATLFIFNSHIATRLPHLMAVHMEWMPIGFLALERLIGRRRPTDALVLGLSVAGAALTSGYLLNYLARRAGGAAAGALPRLAP